MGATSSIFMDQKQKEKLYEDLSIQVKDIAERYEDIYGDYNGSVLTKSLVGHQSKITDEMIKIKKERLDKLEEEIKTIEKKWMSYDLPMDGKQAKLYVK